MHIGVMAIWHNGKVLVLRRSQADAWLPGRWNLPGGKAEPWEKVLQTAIRETLEKTGIKVKDVKLFAVRQRDGLTLWAYQGNTDDPYVTLNQENDLFMWLGSPDEVDKYPYVPFVRDILFRMFSGIHE